MRLVVGLLVCLAAAAAHADVPGQVPERATAAPTSGEASLAAGDESWASTSGSGLLTLADATTLAKKHLNAGIAFDNEDRDPVRLDVADVAITWNYGVRSDVETYGHVVVSRAVIVADRPTIFPPPVDIVVPAGMPVPRRPYYLLYAPFPYVNRSGTSQLAKFVPGDAVLGGKIRLLTARRWRPALAASLELKLPMTRELSSLQAGAGTGGFDQTVRLTGEWRRRRQYFVASVGLTHVGRPPFGDSLIVFPPEGGVAQTDMSIQLASRLRLGLGLRHLLSPRVALVAEMTRVVAFGGRSAAFEASGPLDITAGGQFRWRRLHVTLGVRYHANSVPAFGRAASPFGGMTDLTSVARADRDSYLTAIGAGSAVPFIRDRSQIAVFAPPDGPALPPGARVLPSFYSIRSHDRVGSLLVLGWSFGKAAAK